MELVGALCENPGFYPNSTNNHQIPTTSCSLCYVWTVSSLRLVSLHNVSKYQILSAFFYNTINKYYISAVVVAAWYFLFSLPWAPRHRPSWRDNASKAVTAQFTLVVLFRLWVQYPMWTTKPSRPCHCAWFLFYCSGFSPWLWDLNETRGVFPVFKIPQIELLLRSRICQHLSWYLMCFVRTLSNLKSWWASQSLSAKMLTLFLCVDHLLVPATCDWASALWLQQHSGPSLL